MKLRIVGLCGVGLALTFSPWLAKAQTPAQGTQTLQGQVEALTALVHEQDKEIQKLKQDYEVYKNLAASQLAEQERILRAIAQSDSAGSPVLALKSIMKQSADFRQEMSDVVNDSIRSEGTLAIHNRTASTQSIRVNGSLYQIPPSAVQQFTVPVGTVTTELVGWETPKNWTITAPDYEETVYINPPTSRIVVRSPVVVETSPWLPISPAPVVVW